MLKYEDYKKALDELHFTGTEEWYKFNPFFPVYATDGATWFAEQFECYWLLDDMAAAMMEKQTEAFWVMKITVKNKEATIRYEDGNDKLIKEKHIDYTDLSEGEYELWGANQPGNRVILLRTEY